MPKTLTLTKPLTTHQSDQNPDGKIKELVFRDLVARDLVKLQKPPVYMVALADGSGHRMEVDYKVMLDYTHELTGVSLIALESMSARDLNSISFILQELMAGEDVKN